MSNILSLLTPLISLDGSIYAACSYIRGKACSPGTGITSAAMTAACVIVLFLTIKTAHDLMSDEQQSGFGGITLWQICRPIVILLAIFNFNLIDSVINGVCNYVSTSVNLSANIDDIKQAANKNTKRKAEIANLANPVMQEIYANTGVASTEEMTNSQKIQFNTNVALNEYQETLNNGNFFQKGIGGAKALGGLVNGIVSGLVGNTVVDAKVTIGDDGQITVVADENANKKWYDKIGDVFGNFNLTNFVLTVYKYVFPIVLISGEILLCVLVFFGPWSLVFSLLPSHHDAFNRFIMTYLQVCCWKPVASIVNWATVNIMDWVNGNEITATGYSRLADTSLKIGQADFLLIVVAIAGIKTMFKVPSIAAMIVPGGDGGAASAGGAGIEIASAATSEVVKAPVKAAGLLVGKK